MPTSFYAVGTRIPVCDYCWGPVERKLGKYGRILGWNRFCSADCKKGHSRHGAWQARRFPAPPGDVTVPMKGGVNFARLAAGGRVEEAEMAVAA